MTARHLRMRDGKKFSSFNYIDLEQEKRAEVVTLEKALDWPKAQGEW